MSKRTCTTAEATVIGLTCLPLALMGIVLVANRAEAAEVWNPTESMFKEAVSYVSLKTCIDNLPEGLNGPHAIKIIDGEQANNPHWADAKSVASEYINKLLKRDGATADQYCQWLKDSPGIPLSAWVKGAGK